MHTLLMIAEVIVSIILIALVMAQPSKSQGLSGFMGGGQQDTFYAKNKTRTHEAFLSKATVVFAILFALIIVLLNFY